MARMATPHDTAGPATGSASVPPVAVSTIAFATSAPAAPSTCSSGTATRRPVTSTLTGRQAASPLGLSVASGSPSTGTVTAGSVTAAGVASATLSWHPAVA